MRKLLLLLALPLTAADVRVVEEIIVKINGEIITRSEMEKAMTEARAEFARQKLEDDKLAAALAERQKDVLRDLIDNSLLVQRGKELTISVDTQLIKYLDEMRRQYNIASMEEFEKYVVEKSGSPYEDLKDQIRNQLLTQRVIGQEVGSRISVPKEEIAKYYEEHKTEFVRPEQVHLREIMVSTDGKDPKDLPALEKKANDLLARIRKGERFTDLAQKNSDSESAKAGGDIGFFKRGVLDKQIEEMVFAARRGFVSEVLKRPNGFLIIRLEERHQEGQAALAEVEQDITERLYMPRMQPALREYLTKLREHAFLEIRAGYVDSGAVPGKDTSWRDPEQFKAAVTTKAEVTAKKRRRLLWVVPLGGGKASKDSKDKEKDQQAKPAAEKPAVEKPAAERPAAEKPAAEKPAEKPPA